jgi:hypothetical protein
LIAITSKKLSGYVVFSASITSKVVRPATPSTIAAFLAFSIDTGEMSMPHVCAPAFAQASAVRPSPQQ